MGYGARLGLHAGDGRRKYVNGSERARLLAVLDTREPLTRSFCLTLLHTGCRVSEALALTPAAIDCEAGLIAIRSLKKRGSPHVREVPVPEALIALLDRTHALSSRQAALDPLPLWPWSRTRAWRIVKAVMDEARVTGLQACPKGLRHGFGVQAIRAGVPLNLLQKWLGHASLETTAIYANASGPEERAIAARMWG